MDYSERARILKKEYPEGTRVKLISTNDKYTPLKSGTMGTVFRVDGIGTIHVKWDNGSMLGVVPEEDIIEKVG